MWQCPWRVQELVLKGPHHFTYPARVVSEQLCWSLSHSPLLTETWQSMCWGKSCLCSWTSTHQVNGSLTFHRSPQAGVPCLLLYPILWWSDSIMLYWTQYWPYEVPWALPCLLSWTYMHPLSKWPIHVSIPSLRLELVGALYLIHYPAWQWVKSPILPMNSNL